MGRDVRYLGFMGFVTLVRLTARLDGWMAGWFVDISVHLRPCCMHCMAFAGSGWLSPVLSVTHVSQSALMDEAD